MSALHGLCDLGRAGLSLVLCAAMLGVPGCSSQEREAPPAAEPAPAPTAAPAPAADLGPETARLAGAIDSYEPGAGWSEVDSD